MKLAKGTSSSIIMKAPENRIVSPKVLEKRSSTSDGEVRDGFEEFGGYMNAKKAKLDVQLNQQSNSKQFGIFNGISIWINGFTGKDPPEPELREMFILHGGKYHPYRTGSTTYVIATNLSAASKNIYGKKTVKPKWITDSIEARKLLDAKDYMLYDYNQENNQLTLTQIMNGHEPKCSDNSSKQSNSTPNDSSKTPNNSLNGLLVCNGADQEATAEDCLGTKSPTTAESPSTAISEPAKRKSSKIKTAMDAGFIDDFFENSRLHLISSQKRDMQCFIGDLRQNSHTHDYRGLERFKNEISLKYSDNSQSHCNGELDKTPVIFHVDFDCFFVSVGLLSRPELRGKPVIVTHASGKTEDSKSDIACASYEARKYGIKNGMWVQQAKEKCPSVVVIPYDFNEYRRISKLFFETVASVTLDIEVTSIDEMLVDVSSVLKDVDNATPENLAVFLRKIIYEATKCTASIGVGSNRLLSYLATKKAKPDGYYHLKDCDSKDHIASLNVNDLPGLGYSITSKLSDLLQVHKCSELRNISLKELTNIFGEQTAKRMFNLCRGTDNAVLKYGYDRPKTISVDINYGLRFGANDFNQWDEFLMSLCKELSKRALKSRTSGMDLQVKLLVRKKGAGEPLKHGGHGIVDSFSRSARFLQPTREWEDIYRVLKSTMRLFSLGSMTLADYRGIGLSLGKLVFDFDKKSQISSTKKQTTLFDMSRGRSMLAKAAAASNNKSSNIPVSTFISKASEQSLTKSKLESPSSTPPVENQGFPNGVAHQEEVGGEPEVICISPDLFESSQIEESNVTNGVEVGKNESEIGPAPPPLPEKVDLEFLKELPKDIARELAQYYGINENDIDDGNNMVVDYSTDGKSGETSSNVNPYSEVDEIDPAYLNALPASLRNEVLIQFQEAKGNKNPTVSNGPTSSTIVDDGQQPCSSKQALERDAARLRNTQDAADTANNSTTDTGAVIPLPLQSPKRSSTESTTATTAVSDSDKENLENFWDDDNRQTYCQNPTDGQNENEKIQWPSLNGKTDINDVRDLIQDGLQTIKTPLPHDVECLQMYLNDLIGQGWMKQARVILKFLYRKLNKLSPDSEWSSALSSVIQNSQERCRTLRHGVFVLE